MLNRKELDERMHFIADNTLVIYLPDGQPYSADELRQIADAMDNSDRLIRLKAD